MSDEAVISFVVGYMPSYELYLDTLRRERFVGEKSRGSHLRLVLDGARNVEKMIVLNE